MRSEAAVSNLWSNAYFAGMIAGGDARPEPMLVSERANPLNDSSSVRRVYYVAEGACGFASVRIKPGNSALARYLVKKGIAYKSSYGGVVVPVRGFGQSLERKEAAAYAISSVLNEAGINSYVESRMD